jgi:dephospho-CoA kinase
MLLVALTGNYGMGKSTVLSLFRKFGVSTLDADEIVDSLFRRKKILEKIRQLMGDSVFHDSGSLNKKKVAEVIFRNTRLRRSVEDALHPFVFEKIKDFLEKMNINDKILIVAVPLVYERAYEDKFDETIVVHTTEETALHRLGMKGVSRRDALLRLKTQMPIEEKMRRADFLITNDGTLNETKVQVEKLLKNLLRKAGDGDNQRTRRTKRKLS